MLILHHNGTDEISFTIPQSASDGIGELLDLGTARPFAIQLPDAWTAANLTVRASADGVTFADVFKSGSEFTITAAPAQFLLLGTDLLGLQYLQFRSGVSATPVQQAADRTLKLICYSRL